MTDDLEQRQLLIRFHKLLGQVLQTFFAMKNCGFPPIEVILGAEGITHFGNTPVCKTAFLHTFLYQVTIIIKGNGKAFDFFAKQRLKVSFILRQFPHNAFF